MRTLLRPPRLPWRPGERAASVEEMNQAIADHLAEEDRRTRSGR